MNFIWKDEKLITFKDLMRAILACKTPEEAMEFRRAYEKTNKYAANNIGYLSGYVSFEEASRILDWFQVSHPIFGKEVEVSPEKAFQAGIDLANKMKEK